MYDDYDLDREEGFTGAKKRASWVREFAWWPVQVYAPWHGDGWWKRMRCCVWLQHYWIKRYSAFGIDQHDIRTGQEKPID